MILIISVCAEKLHELEFVKPVEKILKENSKEYFVKNYSELNEEDLKKADKIIICGTSLKDNEFLKNMKNFEWIKDSEKPILGICAGMQIILLAFDNKLKIKQKTELGFYTEKFTRDFLGIKKNSETEVYHLHNNYAALPGNFISFTKSRISQAIKHSSKEIYGVLFHPEVRNKEIIENFINS